MAGKMLPDSDEGIVAGILTDLRRKRATSAASQSLIWEFDTFTITGAGDTTHTLAWVPYGINVVLLNGVGLVEGVAYTCDYTTGVVTVSATLAAADVLHVRYVTTGELKVYSTTADTGMFTYADNFNRADSSVIGGSWQRMNPGGIVGITSNQAMAWTPSGGNLLFEGVETGGSDGTLQLDTAGPDAGSAVMFRGSKTTISSVDHYSFWMATYNRLDLYEDVTFTFAGAPNGGTVTTVTTWADERPPQTWHVTFSGSSITVVAGTTTVYSGTNSTLATGTIHGFGVSGTTSYVDNFTVTVSL